MMVLNVFISICLVAVLFLLRFLFALESELRSARKSSPTRVKPLSIYRIPSLAGANSSGPVLTYDRASGLAFRGFPSSDEMRRRDSQLKGA